MSVKTCLWASAFTLLPDMGGVTRHAKVRRIPHFVHELDPAFSVAPTQHAPEVLHSDPMLHEPEAIGPLLQQQLLRGCMQNVQA